MKMRLRLSPPGRWQGFSLIEMLVSMAVLALLVAVIGQIFTSATSVATLGQKRMDADAQAQSVFDRLAIDIGLMPKRVDVDYFTKDSVNLQTGNDQIAFFSEVPGYFPDDAVDTTRRSPVSLVGYRLKDSGVLLERMGKGLVWAGSASSGKPLVYLPVKIADTWPAAVDQSDDDDYETLGPQVFRFEYGYLLAGRTLPDGTVLPSTMSATPWDSRTGVDHTEINGFRDVAAIVVTIAVIDPRSRVLVSDAQLTGVAADMKDFDPAAYPKPGDLEAQWRTALDSSGLPRPVVASLRVYHRSFPLNDRRP